MGCHHRFTFESADVEIQLPTAERVEQEGGDRVGSVTSRWAANDVPIEFNIEKVDVVVRQGRRIQLPSEILNVPAKAIHLVSREQQNFLDSTTEQHGALALSAFEYWLSVMRWSADDHRIGRNVPSSELIDRGVRLEEVISGKTIWIESGLFVVPATYAVTLDQWNDVGEKLRVLAETPIHKTLELEARHFQERGDFRRSLIDIAVACETYLRTSVASAVATSTDASGG